MPDEQNARPVRSTLIEEDPSFREIVVGFVEDLDGRVRDLESALQAGDSKRVRALCHRLTGVAGGYGYAELTETASALGRSARAGELDDCRRCLDELSVLVRRIQAGIESPD